MLPALRLVLLILLAFLLPVSAANAANGLSVAVPAEGQVAVAVASGVTSVKVKSAPAGVTVTGGVKKGRLAVAVVRPRGAAAKGKVVLKVKGKPKGTKTFAAALTSGRVSAGCSDLAGLLSKRLKGSADVKALGGVLAAKLCGKPAPAGADAVLAKLGLGAAAPAPPATPSGSLAGPGSGSLTPPSVKPGPTPTPPPGGKRACENGADDDGDGQTDWQDPGCSDAGDTTENSEVPAGAECAANSGIGMGEDPTELGVGINTGCGMFEVVEIDVAPGVEACRAMTAENNFDCKIYAPIAYASARDGRATDIMDVALTLTGPVQCAKPYTIALHRPGGQVAELQGTVRNCRDLPQPAPKCANGKDDDGDGMIDSRDAANATDPDPGCSDPADKSEEGETPTPESCDVRLGILNGDKTIPGMTVQGCGVLKGAWFRPPGAPTACGYWFGDDDIASCEVKAGTVGVTFPLTNIGFSLVSRITADYDCRPVTVALIKEDGSVLADRVPFC